MRSAVHDDIALAKLLRQDHAIVVVGASAIALLGWTYLFYQGWAMRHMELVAMAMPSTGAWGPVDVLLVFANRHRPLGNRNLSIQRNHLRD
jgi:predicted metal-binding membrane protein